MALQYWHYWGLGVIINDTSVKHVAVICNVARKRFVPLILPSCRYRFSPLVQSVQWLGCGLDWPSFFRPQAGTRLLSLIQNVQTGCGSHQPPVYCVPGFISPGVERPAREFNHSPSYITELHLYSPYMPSWCGWGELCLSPLPGALPTHFLPWPKSLRVSQLRSP